MDNLIWECKLYEHLFCSASHFLELRDFIKALQDTQKLSTKDWPEIP